MQIAKIILAPIKYIWVVGLLLGLGISAELLRIPGASASQNIGCHKEAEAEAEGCEVYHDDNFCINGEEVENPASGQQNEVQDNTCIERGDEEKSQTHTLGTSTEAAESEKNVLGENTGINGK